MATFGKTTNGASNTLHNANRKILSKVTLTEAAVLTSMTVRARTSAAGSRNWRGVIYSDNANVPGSLLASTAAGTITGTTVAAYTANFAGESLAAGTYWIGFIHNGDATIAVHPYRDNTANMAVSNTDTYADGPASPAGTMSALAGPVDAYVTYTAAATPVTALVDNFDDGARNTTLWNLRNDGNITSVAESGGTLNITSGSGGWGYGGYTSVSKYSLRGKRMYVKVPTVTNTVDGAETLFSAYIDGNNEISLLKGGGALIPRLKTGGTTSDTYPGYTSDYHWWSIREDAGTLYWETSTDGSTWTTARSAAHTFTNAQLDAVEVHMLAGQYMATIGTGKASFDNFNVAPAAPATWNPTSSLSLHVSPGNSFYTYANALPAGTKKNRALWAASKGSFSYFAEDYNNNANLTVLLAEAATAGKTATIVIYSIPHRDNGEFSTGGSTNETTYKAYIDTIAGIIGNASVLISLESDALAGIGGINAAQQIERKACISYAITKLKTSCPNVKLYVDAGHPTYGTPSGMASLLREVGIATADGFTLNSSNYHGDAAVVAHGNAIRSYLSDLKNNQLGFIYDTSRNGSAPTPTYYANPALRRFGNSPLYGNTGVEGVHGYVWIKAPGESDGANAIDAPNPGVFWPKYVYNDSVGDNIDPPSGSTDPTNTTYVATTSGMLQREPAISSAEPYATGGKIKVYVGSDFSAKPVKVWNGSAWVAKPLKRWNGTAWVITNY
jgi:endoglucanase